MHTLHYYSHDGTLSYIIETEDMIHAVKKPLGCSFVGQFEGVLVEQYVYIPIYCRVDDGQEFQVSGKDLLSTVPLFMARGHLLWLPLQGNKIAFAKHIRETAQGVHSYFLFCTTKSGGRQLLYDPTIRAKTLYTVILADQESTLCFDAICPVASRSILLLKDLLDEFDASNEMLNVLPDCYPRDPDKCTWATLQEDGLVPLVN